MKKENERFDVVLGVNGDDFIFASNLSYENAMKIREEQIKKCVEAKTGAYCKIVLRMNGQEAESETL